MYPAGRYETSTAHRLSEPARTGRRGSLRAAVWRPASPQVQPPGTYKTCVLKLLRSSATPLPQDFSGFVHPDRSRTGPPLPSQPPNQSQALVFKRRRGSSGRPGGLHHAPCTWNDPETNSTMARCPQRRRWCLVRPTTATPRHCRAPEPAAHLPHLEPRLRTGPSFSRPSRLARRMKKR